MQISSKTDIGKIRQENQDAFYASILPDKTAFVIVCDGMGGANAGNIASSTAVETVRRYIETAYSPSLATDGKQQLLQNAILSANIELYSMAQKDDNLKGMGTTVVAALADENGAIVCHVGDSRAYLIDKDITQITRDHSVVQSLIEKGEITPEEAKNHPKKNIITRALGVEENVISDCNVIRFNKGAHLLLCSDGLSNYTDSEFIKKSVTDNNPDVADLLCSEAINNGGGDNITVVVISNVQKG